MKDNSIIGEGNTLLLYTFDIRYFLFVILRKSPFEKRGRYAHEKN
jgi:hypothetical protein